MPVAWHGAQLSFRERAVRASGDAATGADVAQSSFRIVPVPRFFVNSDLLLLPNRSR
jgi:hypothetical protein